MASYHANVKDARIIMYLADNQNSGGKTIAEKTGLSESDVSKHLNKLKKVGIVDYNTCSPQDGKNYTGKCWYIIEIIKNSAVFKYLLDIFIGSKNQSTFLDSKYFFHQMDLWHGLSTEKPSTEKLAVIKYYEDILPLHPGAPGHAAFDGKVVSMALVEDEFARQYSDAIILACEHLLGLLNRVYPTLPLTRELWGVLHDVYTVQKLYKDATTVQTPEQPSDTPP